MGALLHPPKPLWMWLPGASTLKGTISSHEEATNPVALVIGDRRYPEMGILGEVALYDWDRQLATEGP